MNKIETNSSDLSIIEKIKTFFRMLPQIINGRYKPNKWNLILFFISTIYVISPIDLIPEIPFAIFGLIDDVAILSFGYSKINKEILNFIDWEKNQQKPDKKTIINID